MKNKRILVFFVVVIAVISIAYQVHSANCGDTDLDGVTDTPCVCGDTIVGAPGYIYQLTGDFNLYRTRVTYWGR